MENEIIEAPQKSVPAREIGVITAEVKEIRRQAQNMALMYAIEIGRRLVEAKSVLNHGEWGAWLHDEVEFSQSTANNFMRLFDEYGSAQISIFGATANSQTFANLPYSKALLLLSLPADERESFAETEDADGKTVRELKAAIEDRNRARETAENERRQRIEIEARISRAEEAAKRAEEAERTAQAMNDRVRTLEEELAAAAEKEKKARERLKEAQKNPKIPPETMKEIRAEAEKAARTTAQSEIAEQIEESKKAAEEAETRVKLAEQLRDTYEKELEDAKKKLKVSNPDVAAFKVLFEEVQRTARAMKEKISAVEKSDPEMAEKLKSALAAFAKTL